MITTIETNGKKYNEFAGTSLDTKPTNGIGTGSIFIEVDTGKVFFYNADAASGSEWVEQFSLQG
jgi:hypothetical protein